MIFIDNFLEEFIKKIKSNSFFDDKKVIRSYPVSVKETLLKQPVIAISFKDIDVDENSVGENVKLGFCSISANIYIPFLCKNITSEKIVSEIAKSVDDFNILSIKVTETLEDSVTECYVTKTVFTFNGEFKFGEVIA